MDYLWLILLFMAVDARMRGNSGPYRTVLTSTHRCPKTQFAMEKVPTITLSVESYNNTRNVTLVRGNFTVHRDTSKLKGKAKQYRWVNGKWKPNLVMHNGACDGIFIAVLVSFLGGKHDTGKCSIPRGDYSFKDLDVNKVTHLWASAMDYGKELWRIEVTSPTGVVDCWEFLDVVVPE